MRLKRMISLDSFRTAVPFLGANCLYVEWFVPPKRDCCSFAQFRPKKVGFNPPPPRFFITNRKYHQLTLAS